VRLTIRLRTPATVARNFYRRARFLVEFAAMNSMRMKAIRRNIEQVAKIFDLALVPAALPVPPGGRDLRTGRPWIRQGPRLRRTPLARTLDLRNRSRQPRRLADDCRAGCRRRAAGALALWLAPEATGHGTDAVIRAFHNEKGYIRARVPLIKGCARSSPSHRGLRRKRRPIVQIGAGFGSSLARLLRLSIRDRRILMLAGVAGGIGAISEPRWAERSLPLKCSIAIPTSNTMPSSPASSVPLPPTRVHRFCRL